MCLSPPNVVFKYSEFSRLLVIGYWLLVIGYLYSQSQLTCISLFPNFQPVNSPFLFPSLLRERGKKVLSGKGLQAFWFMNLDPKGLWLLSLSPKERARVSSP
jgi:hypothetical protein